MEFKEAAKTNIVFKNKPKLSEHDADSKFNDRRINLVPRIEKFISEHERFEGKEVNVTFAQKGISSVVCIIETPKEKMVLKIHLSILRSLDEGQFLSAWEQAGVKVPHVFEEGMLGEHSYVLMEYIDAPLLGEKFDKKELSEKGIYFEMGSTLRAIHEPRGEGYGRVVDGKAEFAKFKDWLMSENMQKRFKYVSENMLLGEEHGSLSLACKLLTEHIGNSTKSSYCHFDFGPLNMFATDPITVFDPNPEFNNGYIDLGLSVTLRIADDGAFPQQMVDGYFAGEPYNEKVLQAAILVNSYMKFYYWHKIKKFERIKNIQEYLIRTKHLLGE